MRKTDRKAERGFSLIVALLALMMLSAVAIGMMFMASTETAISSNFKAEETAYFAARAGVEEARDRMRATSTNPVTLPTVLPPAAGSVLYITQTGVTSANITSAGKLFDDELCHDFPSYFGTTTLNVPCASGPSSTWITTTPSVAPYPLEYKWVRVTQKQNNSAPYWVVPSPAPGNYLVCWNGTNEVATGTTCPAENLPVYLVTALAVTQSGARRLVQQEIALTETSSTLPGGLFATGTGCGALNLAGNAKTGSFNSATEAPPRDPPSNLVLSSGDVGTNGGATLGGTSTSVNGNVSTPLPGSIGSCPANGVSESGNPHTNSISGGAAPYTPPTPPAPNPLPPTTSTTYKNQTLTAGSYGNVTMKGTVTLTGGADINNPAVYTINSLTMNGNANLVITGPVVINLAGIGVSTVLDMTGGGFANNTYVPNDLIINYAGTGGMVITGGTAAFAMINAPNSAITFRGGSNFYGQAIGHTIDDQGGTNFYWDTSAKATVTTTQPYYSEVALRELSY